MNIKSKYILFIAPYQKIYPPINGGMQRTFNILNQLSIHFNTTCISYQSSIEFPTDHKLYPFLKYVKFIKIKSGKNSKGLFSKIWKAIYFRLITRSLFGPADINVIRFYKKLKELLKQNKYDSIILENLSSLNLVGIIRKYALNVPIIYDAHNVETDLFIKKNLDLRNLIHKKESSLCKLVNHVWVCSVADKFRFEQLNNHLINCTVIPNGSSIKTFEKIAFDKKVILFCGSMDYFPNEEGLVWFIDHCWGKIISSYQNIELHIIGSGDRSVPILKKIKQPSIKDYGFVEDVDKYYQQSTVIISPIITGSGTRLKILEAMSYGLPVVSTSKGAEGISYTDQFDIFIANTPRQFLDQVLFVLENEKERLQVGKMAAQLIKSKYDWNIIGNDLAKILHSIE